MAADVQTIAPLLQATLNPRENKQAEISLLRAEKTPGFSITLLEIVAAEQQPYTTRLASALCFKNFVKRHWTDEDGKHILPANEVKIIKDQLLNLMISSPSGIQSQLGDAISVIAESDFWERWDTLVDDLVSRLTADNAVVNNGVLQVAHSIFKRWRPLFRSDELFTEVNHVLSKFAQPFLVLLKNTDRLIDENKNNKEALQQVFTTLSVMIKLFYDLSCQDLPPNFEDNLPGISALLHKYLTYDNPLLRTDDESESGPLEFVKAGICEVLVLYTQKYEDVFGSLLGQFITSSWNLLTTIGPETKYDILVSKALHFLTAVASIKEHAASFNNEETLGSIVEKVILPNLSLRDSDIELFEDEPIEFIRRDLEGSDSDTRRRAATDFLGKLMEQFDQLVTTVVSRYIQHYLADYVKNPKSNWKSKDTAVYLFSSIAAKGVTTTSQGVKNTNQLVNVVDFFQKYVASDLVGDVDVEPILKVDAIKYLYTFRSQLTKEQWHSAFPSLINNLSSSNYVVYTYAAIAVERVLCLTNDARQPVFTKDDILGPSPGLLEHLFNLIEMNPAPEKIQENEFLMRCVMRVLTVIKEGVVPNTDSVLLHLINITKIISKNPSNPRFYYYHFEAFGALIRFAAPSQPEKLENALYEPFANVLQEEVQEFMPYVFQLFAALLEATPSNSLSEYYQSLIPPILLPALWESKGNVPALVRLLSSLISRGSDAMAASNQIEPILGIFQKLVSTKTNELYAFDLLESVIISFPSPTLDSYYVPMLNILFLRLNSTPTATFTSRFVRFYHFLSSQLLPLGTDFFISVAEQVQKDVFVPLYLSVILPTTQTLTSPLTRKTAVVSLTRTLTTSVAFAEKYKKGWAFTCESLLKLLQDPPVLQKGNNDDIIAEQDVDDSGFGVGFTQLNTCRQPPRDFFPQIDDIKLWVSKTLRESEASDNMRISRFASERLSQDASNVLAVYLRG